MRGNSSRRVMEVTWILFKLKRMYIYSLWMRSDNSDLLLLPTINESSKVFLFSRDSKL